MWEERVGRDGEGTQLGHGAPGLRKGDWGSSRAGEFLHVWGSLNSEPGSSLVSSSLLCHGKITPSCTCSHCYDVNYIEL